MNLKNLILILLFWSAFYSISFSQENSDSIEQNNYWEIQFEATSLLFSNEIGALFDYDLISYSNGKYSIGFLIGTEYYNRLSLDVGGGGNSYTNWDISFYGRHSIRGKNFNVSPFIGLSFHLLHEDTKSDKFLIKWGMEWEYNLYKNIVGLMLKWALSINKKETGYLGLGITYKINNQ